MSYIDEILNGDKPKVPNTNTSYFEQLLNQQDKAHATDVQLGQFGVGESPYDYQVSPGNVEFLDEIRGQTQGRFNKLGSGLANAVTHTGLDIIKDASYLLDYENYTDFKKSSEEGFSNFLADNIQAIEDKIKLPVYRTEASKGFSPLSAGFWGENMPSIASTVAMMFPAEAATMGLAKLGKTLGGAKIIQGLESVSGATKLGNTVKGLSSAVVSRQMENIMEAGQTFEETKKDLLDAGVPEAEATERAGEAAASNYKMNWVNLTTDIPQYMLLHKSFKQSMKDLKLTTADHLKTMAQEAGEEAYQYISNEEAKRDALIKSGVLEDNKSDIVGRLGEYVKDEDLWTSAFLGGLGGGLFSGVTAYNNKRNAPKLEEQYKMLLALHTAAVKGDKGGFSKVSDNYFATSLMAHIKEGTVPNFKEMLDETITVPEDPTEVAETKKRLRERNEVIKFAEEYRDQLASDNTKTADVKAFELNAAINQVLTANRLKETNNEINRLTIEDSNALGLQDFTLHQFKLAKLRYEAIKDIPQFKNEASELNKTIEDNYKAIIAEGKYSSKEAIDQDLASAYDKPLINLLRNKELDIDALNQIKEVLYKTNTEEGRADIQKDVDKARKEYEAEQEKATKEAEKQAKADAKATKQAEKESEVTEEDVTITKAREEFEAKMDAAMSAPTAEEYEVVYNDLVNNHSNQLTAEDKETLDGIRAEHLKDTGVPVEDLLSDPIEVFAKKIASGTLEQTPENQQFYENNKKAIEKELAKLAKESKPTKGDIAEDTGKFLSENTTAFVKDEEQATLVNEKDLAKGTEPDKGIKSKINVVMMRLFKHKFIDGIFKFTRNSEGFPAKDNDSNIDIIAINEVRIGDKVEIRLTNISSEGLESNKENIETSINNGAKAEDFDGKALGIYHDNRLIGFVQEPHVAYKPDIKDDSEILRQRLIAYRKAVIAKLLEGKAVTEKISEKGNGNLYTKLKPESTKIDASRKVIETSRDKDRVNGILLFVAPDKSGKLVLKSADVTPKKRKEIENALSSFNGYKPGQPFQVVKDLNDSWAVIPVYTNTVDKYTADKIISVLESFNNDSKPGDIVRALNELVYASATDRNASVFIHKLDGPTAIKIGTSQYYLEELKSTGNPVRKEAFIASLNTKRQNIATDKVNTKAAQIELVKRNALVTNVMPFMDEYYVQPYIEYTQNVGVEEELPKKPKAIRAKKIKPIKADNPVDDDIFGGAVPISPTDAPLSRTLDNTPLNRKNVDKWLKKHLPQFKIGDVQALAHLKLNLVDVYGIYKDMNLYLFEGAGNKTAYHEAFHGVFRNLLSPDERHSLLLEASKKYPKSSLEDLQELQSNYSTKYTQEQLTLLYYEEKLADDFAEYTNNYNNRGIGQRILDFFIRLAEYFNIFTTHNQDNVDELFRRINAKEFSTKSPNTAKASIINRPFEVFINELAYSKKLNEAFGTASGKYEVIKSVGNQFMSIYQREIEKGTKEFTPKQIFDVILDQYRQFLVDGKGTPEQRNHAKLIGGNWAAISNEVRRYLSYRGLGINETYTAVEKQEGITEEKAVGDEEMFQETQAHTTKGLGEWTSISGLSSASNRLKYFLSSIPVLDNDNEIVKDVYGIEQFYDFSKLYYYIERNLTGLYTLEDQVERMYELASNRPELSSVINKLMVKASTTDNEQFEMLQNDFKTNFSKQQLAYTLVKVDTTAKGKTTYQIFDANRNNIARETLGSWEENLRDPNRDTIVERSASGEIDKIFNTSKAIDTRDKWEAIKKSGKFNSKAVNRLLNSVGIEYSTDVLNNLLKTTNDEHKDFLIHVSRVLGYYASPKHLDLEAGARQSLSILVGFEVNNTLNAYTSSFNNVEGKAIYTIQLPSYASKLLTKLKSSAEGPNGELVRKNTIAELRKDPFFKHSNILNELENNPSFHTKFNMSYVDGLKDQRGESEGVKLTSMNPKDYAATQLALFQNSYANTGEEKKQTPEAKAAKKEAAFRSGDIMSKYIYLIAADKTMAMIFDARRYRVTVDILDTVSSKVKHPRRVVNVNSEIVGKFYNVFLSEASRIKQCLDIKNDILSRRDKADVKLMDLLQYKFSNGDAFNRLSELAKKQNTKDSLDENDWKEVEGLFNGLGYEYNYFTEAFIKAIAPYRSIIESTPINDLEKVLESTKDGKGIFIKDRILAALSGKDGMLTEEMKEVKEELKDLGLISEVDNLLSSNTIETEATTPEAIDQELRQLIADYSLNSLLHNIELSNLFNGDYAQYKPNDLQKRTYQSQSMFTNNRFAQKYIRTMVIKDVEEPAEDIKELHKELITLGFTKEQADDILGEYGTVNITDAQVYITPSLYMRIHKSRGTWTKEMQLAHDVAEGNRDITKLTVEERQSIRLQLGAIKPFYYGSRFDETLGMFRNEQVKCSMIPLYKVYTDLNPLLKAKRTEMENIGVEMLAHESAFKAAIGFRDSIFSDDFVVLDLDSDNFGIQVDNPEHILDTENDSLRQLKMLLIGSIDVSKTYKGTSGQNILDTIMQMEATNVKVALDKMLRDLDVKNSKNFNKFLKEMVTKRGATINIEELLEIINGEFKYPLDNGNLSTMVENMIASIITNHVIKQPFAEGGSGVQATSLGFKFRDLTEQQEHLTADQKLIQQELKWIRPGKGTIEYAECAMPAWSSKFFGEDGLLIDANNIPEELRQLVMYRIPTEGLHSMLPIKVVKFLPEAMGNFILLPYQVTRQFGADFDFDKTFFIGREFYEDYSEDGTKIFTPYKYIKGLDKESSDKRYAQYMKHYLTTDDKEEFIKREVFDELPIEEQNSRAARNNAIIDSYLHLLTSPENLHLLVKPSGFNKMAKVKDAYFKKEDKHSFFSSITQRSLKYRNHVGLALKGQSALHVSGHAYAMLMNLYSGKLDENNVLMESTLINFNGENRGHFNNMYTKDHSLIADELSSIMAAILDDIKKPILASLGINKHTIDVLATIIRAGYNMDTALMFVAQPGIKHLSSMLDLNYDVIKESGTPRVSPNTLIGIYEEQLEDALEKLPNELRDPEVMKAYNDSLSPWSDITNKEMDAVLKVYKDKDTIIDSGANLKERIKYYSFQIRVLKQFRNIQPIAEELVEINKFFGINKEVGPNVENIIAKEELLTSIQTSDVLEGFDLDKIPTLARTWEVHQEAKKFLENYFPYSTDQYMNLKRSILGAVTTKKLHQVSIKDRMWMNSFIRYFIDNNSPTFQNMRTRYKDLFAGFPIQLSRIKQAKYADSKMGDRTYDQIRHNLFISQLEVRPIKDEKMWHIKLKGNRLDLQIKNATIESFTALYNDSDTRDIALDLIDHSFINSGFWSGLNSYASLIPPHILGESGYMNYRKDILNILKSGAIMFTKEQEDLLVDQIVRNTPKMFTKVFDTDIIESKTKIGGKDVIDISVAGLESTGKTRELIFKRDKDGNPIKTAKYIRIFNKATYKMMLYKEIEPLQYELIGYLGKKGFFIEVDATENISGSFVMSNNPDGARYVVQAEEDDVQAEEEEKSYEDKMTEDMPKNDEANDSESEDSTPESDTPEGGDGKDLPNNIKPC